MLQEKYDAQNRQFKLQQEFNVNTSKQFDLLRQNHENGYEVQKRLLENQHQMSLSPYPKEAPPQEYVPSELHNTAGNG